MPKNPRDSPLMGRRINYFDILSASLCSTIRLSTRVWMTKGNRVRRIRNFLAARAVHLYCSIFFHRTKPLTPLRTRAWFSSFFHFGLNSEDLYCPLLLFFFFFSPLLCRERTNSMQIYIYITLFLTLSKEKDLKISSNI